MTTLVDILRMRAEERPAAIGFTFLDGGVTEGARLTYGDLDRRARAIAATLQRTTAPGDRALLLYPTGPDFIAAFFGCLYARRIAVPAQPPRRGRPSRRIRAIVADARPAVILEAGPPATRPAHEDLAGVPRLSTDAIDAATADAWVPCEVSADDIALLQYTSGSTSVPRGVMVSHGNVMHNSECIRRAFDLSSASVSASWLPCFHDMGLIDGVLQPVYSGFPAYLMGPASFIQSPLRWLRAISRYRVTHSGGPNFGYALCVQKSRAGDGGGAGADLDLSCWTSAYNGAEPIHAETLAAFCDAFAPHGFRSRSFYPCYGLAEATLMVTGGTMEDEPKSFVASTVHLERHQAVSASSHDEKTRTLTGCGSAQPATRVLVVDPSTRERCADGRIGEIWVQGPSVARGYWQRAELTSETFGARVSDADEGAFLRTGDLGFLLYDELFVTGRLKDLLIVRGRNHYPHDIEFTAELASRALSSGNTAVFTVRDDETESLVLIAEVVNRTIEASAVDEIASAIRCAIVDEHDLRIDVVVLVEPRTIAKTSSGKIERHTIAEEYRNGRLREIGRSVLPRDEEAFVAEPLDRAELAGVERVERHGRLVRYVADCVREALGSASVSLDRQRSLSAVGLDSLRATQLAHRFERELGAMVHATDLLQDGGIDAIAERLDAALSTATDSPCLRRVVTESGDHPLSSGQRALWFFQQLAPASAVWNLAVALRARPAIAADRWRAAFAALVARHQALRTTVAVVDGWPVQRVSPVGATGLECVDLRGLDADAVETYLADAAAEPFDLQTGPLVRAHLCSCDDDEQVLLLTAHHIVADLWSATVLVDELRHALTAQASDRPLRLPAPERQSADHAYWQETIVAGPEGERQWQYWRDAMDGAPTRSELPADRPRTGEPRFVGATERFDWSASRATRLRAFAARHGASPYVVLLTAYRTLVHRYTSQSDFVVGISTAGRARAACAGTVGYLVNQLPVRVRMTSATTFGELIADVTRIVDLALAHEDLPFPLLVERLQPERDGGVTPFFQTMFVLAKAHSEALSSFVSGASGARLDAGEITLDCLAVPKRTAAFDLTISVSERVDGLTVAWEYDSALFDRDTIVRMNGHFDRLVDAMIADATRSIAEAPILSDDERRTILVDWNRSESAGESAVRVHRAFEAQVRRTPEAIAIQFDDRLVSYDELNVRANQLAHRLRTLGVGPEVVVGICLRRSPDLVVAVLAALKAGGAYLPLDPSYPRERLSFMTSV
jgi:acyl-CoA synthetase (AMP-forming)/AMP-acid ligase II/aryl carrier-like protein